MARIVVAILSAAFFAGATLAMAADESIRTCALTTGIECTPDQGCDELSIQEMALPRFVRIDLNGKTITSLDKEVPRSTKIASIDRLADLTVLHGTELRGWTIALGKASGALTLSASGEGEGFIVFGNCINP